MSDFGVKPVSELDRSNPGYHWQLDEGLTQLMMVEFQLDKEARELHNNYSRYIVDFLKSKGIDCPDPTTIFNIELGIGQKIGAKIEHAAISATPEEYEKMKPLFEEVRGNHQKELDVLKQRGKEARKVWEEYIEAAHEFTEITALSENGNYASVFFIAHGRSLMATSKGGKLEEKMYEITECDEYELKDACQEMKEQLVKANVNAYFVRNQIDTVLPEDLARYAASNTPHAEGTDDRDIATVIREIIDGLKKPEEGKE